MRARARGVCVCVCVCVLPGAYFKFPTLSGNKFTTDGNGDIDLPFNVDHTCKYSQVNNTYIKIAKDDTRSPRCLFLQWKKCSSNDNNSCRCPEDGTDRYHFRLPADRSNNGTWVWSAWPPVVEQRKIDILVTGE